MIGRNHPERNGWRHTGGATGWFRPIIPKASIPIKFSRFRDLFLESEKMPDPGKVFGICACLNLDAMSVPEAVVYSIGILEAPGVFLARRWLKS